MNIIRFSLCILSTLLPLSLSWANFTITTYNIRNFDYDARSNVRTNKSELAKILSSLQSGMVAVQEIVNEVEFKSFVQKTLPNHQVVHSKCGGAGKQKVGLLVDKTLYTVNSFKEDSRVADSSSCNSGLRPALIVNITEKATNLNFDVIVVHLKAGGKQSNADVRYRQYQILSEILNEMKQLGKENFIILGDFNSTDYNLRNQNYQRFIDFVDLNDLIDPTAELECSAYWWGGIDDGIEYSSLLDHVIVSTALFNQFKTTAISNEAHCKKVSCKNSPGSDLGLSFLEVSDHCPIKFAASR
jgi:endonuclease/exonuclease/phosphatase family metal-dependent hydrolase